MTALFVVMFIDQWEDASIVLCFLGMNKHEEKRKKERIQKSGEYQA